MDRMRDIGNDRVQKPSEAIRWYDGLLLAPAHFQQLCLRQEELLAYQLRAAAPYAWGVRRAEIDRAMLAQGVFALTALEAIMPDGLLLIHEPAFGQLLLRLSDSQVDELQNKGRQLKLYLAVTASNSADAQGGAGRYRNSVDGEPGSAGAAPLGIERIRPAPRVLAEADLKPGSDVVLPLALLGYQNQQYTLQPFLPPLLDIAIAPLDGGPSLQKQALDFLERLNGSTGRLARDLAQANLDRNTERQLDLREKLRSLSAGAPLLTATLCLTAVSPLALYLSLSSVLGALYMLRDMSTPAPDHPAYQHGDLHTTFDGLLRQLHRLLDRVERSYTEHAFQLAPILGGDAFQLRLQPEWQSGWPVQSRAGGPPQTVLVIGLRGLPGAAAVQWLQNAAIACAGPLMRVRALRTRGAVRSLINDEGMLVELQDRIDEHSGSTLHIAADELRADSTTLFAIAMDPELISAGDTLVLDWAGLPRPREIVLFVRVAAAGGASTGAAAS
jgi:type VI secretion system protein ImpJ